MFKKLIISFLAVIFHFQLTAQTSISGIINTYTKVNTIDTCKNALTVASVANFKKGENVLLIQMNGALINEGQSSVYGNLVNMKSAGLYEINSIDSIFTNIIFFKNKFVNYYQSDASVQLVTIPTYQDAVVTDTLKAQKWDGQTGGVLIFDVKNELGLLSYISGNGQGFRGGARNPNPDPNNSCNSFLVITDYFVAKNSWRSGNKGEGLSVFASNKEAGRGAQLNGGGGGNDHNSGGGGGSNIVKGGQGGVMLNNSLFGCSGPSSGIGGKAISLINNRLYLGGGGGAGHGNNGVSTSGGDGGALIFIMAKKITGDGTRIFSNGMTSKGTTGDGAGGGGAGGTVVLDVSEISGNLKIQALGGNGGDNESSSDGRCFGPGGGGGGRVITTTGLTLTYDLKGGVKGFLKNPVCGSPDNGAQKGDDGSVELNQFLAFAKKKFETFAITKQPLVDTVCVGKSSTIKVNTSGIVLSYQWQIDNGTGFQNLSDGFFYDGTNSQELTILSASNSIENAKFQCVITSLCGNKVTSKPISVLLKDAPKAGFNYTLNGVLIAFNNSSENGVSYSWSFGDGTTSTDKNPVHLFTQDGDFPVELTVYSACGFAIVVQTITIVSPTKADFKADTTLGCAPFKVKFKNLSSQNSLTYKWTFAGADIASSTLKEPSVTYLKSGVYGVTLEASNSLYKNENPKSGYIVINEKPIVDFVVKSQNGKNITFDNLTQFSNTFTWDFGDGGTAQDKNPSHFYSKDGEYTVVLTAKNNCGTSILPIKIKVLTLPKAAFVSNLKTGCVPLTVSFSDLTPQSVESRKWIFSGAKQDTSSQKNPTVIYEKAGIYPVKLYVSNSSGKDSIVSLTYMEVFDKPKLDFSLTNDKLKIQSDNLSVDAKTYLWSTTASSFSSKDKNIAFSATKSGTYIVKLAGTNQCGTSTLDKTITVTNELACEAITMTFKPNPATFFTTLSFNAARKSEMPYLITTIDGRILESGNLASDLIEKEISLENYANGIYIFHLKCDEKVFNTKVVKAD